MIESSKQIATIVQDSVNSVHDHGLLQRIWCQPRRPGMSSASEGSVTKTSFVFECSSCRDGEVFQPLDMGFASGGILSSFRLSRVSECLLTSNLAEVKLLFLSSLLEGGGSAFCGSVKLRSSESDDLLRIASGRSLHSESGKREEEGRLQKAETVKDEEACLIKI